MNKYSKLSRDQMIEVLNILHPNTTWKFHQELVNEKGTNTTIEFLGQDTSCAQFNIDRNEQDSLRFYYKMEDDFDTSEKEGKSMLEKKEVEIDKFLNQSNGVKEENNLSELKDPKEQIKSYYLVKGEEDKFTKTTEYLTKYISFKSNLVDSYVKSKDEFGIGSALIRFCLLYRKKGDVDVCLIKIKITYFTMNEYFRNPNILKDLNIIFLADDEPVEITEQTAHDFGAGEFTGFEEIGLLSIGVDNLIKICIAEKLEFRMSGSRGVFNEQEVDESTMFRIKGFYNALFDQDYEVEYLIEGIKKEKAKAKKEEEERKKKEEERKKKKESSPTNSSSNCFVVTATMGDVNHPIVNDFRTFRDEHLLTNYFGKHFVSLYYKIGPYFASLIEKNTWLKKMTFEKFIKPIHKRIKNVD
jgi:hypothetical protein